MQILSPIRLMTTPFIPKLLFKKSIFSNVFNDFVFFCFFSLEIEVETPLERCAVKHYAFWLLETLNFLSECQVMAKLRVHIKTKSFRASPSLIWGDGKKVRGGEQIHDP